MKINIDRIQKAKKNVQDDELWQITNEIIQEENAMIILAAVSSLGLGPKRINAFLEEIEKVKQEFDEYAAEGRQRDKIIEYLRSYKIDEKRVFSSIDRYDIAQKRLGKALKPKEVSLSEAAEMQEKLKFMKGLM